MKVLFITTFTVDCDNHVRAWRSFAPTEHLRMRHCGIGIDGDVVRAVREAGPELVFYISANQGPYALKMRALADIRGIARSVNLCSDAADRPWHSVLAHYDKHDCFDLQVSLDGGRHRAIGLSTLTPVDPAPYEGPGPDRDIRCGFSGSVGRWNPRSEIVNALEWFGGLTVRARAAQGGYEDHVHFLRRCRMLLNASWTGSGQAHHIKGRVVEAGWAGCALLESEGSPIGDWFPDDCYFLWRDARQAAEIIADASDADIDGRAARLAAEVRARFHPATVYGEMLKRIGYCVDSAEPRPAA